MDFKVHIARNIARHVTLPESKSIAARELIINAAMGTVLDVAFCCDDTAVMAHALACDGDNIDVGGAGTAMRFLTAYFAIKQGRTVTIDGNERMRQRPMGVLVDALRQMGASIDYLGREGFPPVKITGKQLHGGTLRIDGGVSSQFVSALLMIAPLTGGMTLELEGAVVSRPYIDMTLGVMRNHGVAAKWTGNSIEVPAGNYTSSPIIIEGDWSAASYWLALKALLPESQIELSPLHENSLQGDRAIVELMEPLGVRAQFRDNGVVVLGAADDESTHTLSWEVRPTPAVEPATCGCYECEMSAIPDLVPTMAVTLCLLRVPYVLTGVRTLRLKESDRLEALRDELAKLGYTIEVEADSLHYDGNFTARRGDIVLDPHGDHRMAMALSVAATRHNNIIIKDAEVVTKSYPGWWEALGVSR